jgi:hypothetical protein
MENKIEIFEYIVLKLLEEYSEIMNKNMIEVKS